MYNQIVEKLWKLIDKEIGKIMDKYPDSNILIMSDHGMEKINTYFNIGRWLQEQGHCTSKENDEGASLMTRLGLKKKNIFKLIKKFHMNWLLKLTLKTIPYEIARETAKMVRTDASTPDLDWENSDVIPSGKLLYLKPDIENKEDFKKRLKENISKIETPEKNRKIIQKVQEKEEIFKGEYSEIAPDLAIMPKDDVWVKSHLGKDMWGENLTRWIASHIPNGILMGYGPDIKENLKIENAYLVDLAPTILRAFGLSTGEEMEGKALKEIFKDVEKTDVKTKRIESEKEKIKNRINKLKKEGKI